MMMEEPQLSSELQLLKDLKFQPMRTAVKQAIAVVDEAMKGNRDILPTKWPRLNRQLLGGLQPCKLYIIAGRPGCLSGDTKIYVARKGNDGSGRWYTLKHLYEHFNGIGEYRWDLTLPTQLNVYKHDVGLTGLHKVSQVVQSGMKTTYEVVTSSGKRIRTTKDHRFLTSTSDSSDEVWKRLEELVPGDKVVCKAPDVSFGRKPRPYRPEINRRMPYYPSARSKRTVEPNTGITYSFHRIKRTRAVYDAYLNNLTLKDFLLKVSSEPEHGLVFSDINMDVHHIDGNCLNDSVDNLVLLSKEDHQRLHSDGLDYQLRLGKRRVHLESIVSIGDPKEEMTYDISMEDPYHNFLAEGFVVHNSGKSAFSNQLLFDVLDLASVAGRKVVVFYWSYEMPGYQQILRSASKDTSKSLADLYSVDEVLRQEDFKRFVASVNRYNRFPIYFQNRPKPVEFIEDAVKRYHALNPDTLILNIIDHSRLVPEEKVQEELIRLNNLSKGLMRIHAETYSMSILLSQLNRNIEGVERAKSQYQPLLSDLFGGDSGSQDAHCVMIIQRPHDLYGITSTYNGEDPRKLLAIHIEKNRDGVLGMVPFDFDGARFTITERPRK